MALETLISRFSSLNFSHNWRTNFQIDVPYRQKFINGDVIHIQYSVPVAEQFGISVTVTNQDTNAVKYLSPSVIRSDDEYVTYDVFYTASDVGSYIFTMYQNTTPENVIAWAEFCVIDDASDTILITYGNRKDDFDSIFGDNTFSFRVEGVFLPSEKSFDVDAESFRDQRYSLNQLSAFPYTKETLTVGGGYGVPNWVAEKLNLIFSLSSVYIDGIPYVRSDGSVPEVTTIHSDYPLFLYKIEVESKQSNYLQGIDTFEAYPLVSWEKESITNQDSDLIYG